MADFFQDRGANRVDPTYTVNPQTETHNPKSEIWNTKTRTQIPTGPRARKVRRGRRRAHQRANCQVP